MTAILWVLLVFHPQTQLYVPVIWTKTERACEAQRAAFYERSVCLPVKQGDF